METRPGYKTTEFWVTVFIQIIGVLVLTGTIGSEQGNEMSDALAKLAALVAQVGAGFGYSLSRGKAKVGIAAEPNVVKPK